MKRNLVMSLPTESGQSFCQEPAQALVFADVWAQVNGPPIQVLLFYITQWWCKFRFLFGVILIVLL